MNLIKYRPRTLFDTMFDDSFVSYPRQFDSGFDPRVDVAEHEKDYVISFELPGVDKKDIRVSVENGYLMISGEKKYESSDSDTNTWRRERRYGSFKRSFRLGDGIDQKNIDGSFKDGVLEISVPKTKESLKKEIEIKIS